MEQKTGDSKILDDLFIYPRKRKCQKWTLGYDHYALLSKYIYDYHTLVNFIRVCTRTTAPFNLPSNLGVNIEDPNDWKKLNKHMIHTDRTVYNPFFIQGVEKAFTGSYLSFRQYLTSTVYIMFAKGKSDLTVSLIYGNKVFPTELIDIIANGLEQSKEIFYKKPCCKTEHKIAIYKYKYDKAPFKAISWERLEEMSKGKRVSAISLDMYDLFRHIFNRVQKQIYDDKVVVGGISFPRCHMSVNLDIVYPDGTTNGKISTVIRKSRLCFERHSVSPCCDIDLIELSHTIYTDKGTTYRCGFVFGWVPNREVEIVVVNLVAYNHNRRDDFTVVVMDRRLYNSIIARDSSFIEPINNRYSYYKNTNVIISYLGGNMILDTLLEEIKSLDSKFSDSKSRFITDLYIYQTDLDHIGEVIDGFTGECTYVMPLLGLKYNYIERKSDYKYYVSSIQEEIFYEHIRDLFKVKVEDIKTLKIDDNITRHFVIFNDDAIIACDILKPSPKDNGKLDKAVAFYTDDGIIYYTECIGTKYDYLIQKSIGEGNYILEYLINGNESHITRYMLEFDSDSDNTSDMSYKSDSQH